MTTAEAMRLAIAEAYKGASRVSPNPLVGCVVLDRNGDLLQAGHHEFYGGPHAEVNALKNLSHEQLKDAHVIVTLEPCAHEGKTPSCAKALAKLPIKKVTFGLVDPNPLVAGQGADIVRQAGIEANVFSDPDSGLENEIKSELVQVCEAFLKNYNQKKIFYALKLATSLDGQVALSSGESKWITGTESREYVHYLRSCFDAILVGKKTVLNDNPSLDIRHPEIQKENKVIVLDSGAELLTKSSQLKIFSVHKPENIFWCVASDAHLASVPNGIHICRVSRTQDGMLDLAELEKQLWSSGIRSVFVEGGATVASEFLRHKMIDRLFLFQAPIIMGSVGASSWTQTLSISKMQDKLTLDYVKRLNFGPDSFLTGRVNYQNHK